jgi:TMEM175 potassium channel family protein
MPFSTAFLGQFITYRLAVAVYWSNIFLLGVVIYWSWVYATRAGLLKSDMAPEISIAIKRRIVAAQSLYALGALLCFINT